MELCVKMRWMAGVVFEQCNSALAELCLWRIRGFPRSICVGRVQ